VLAENRFLASRDGMRAQLIDPRRGRAVPIREQLARVLDACAPAADDLGCAAELAGAAALAEDPGEQRQRHHVAEHGLPGLPAHLAAEFTGMHVATAR
jgi:glutamate---cysteine ligase / carboxylate-amine ligase